MLQFAFPLALFGYLRRGQSGVGDDRTVYGAIGAKALALLSPTSALIYPMSLVVLLATLLLLFAVLRHGFAEIDRRLLPLPLALACLCLVMPNMVLGIWGLDFRYPFIALLLLISAVRDRKSTRLNSSH